VRLERSDAVAVDHDVEPATPKLKAEPLFPLQRKGCGHRCLLR
jgi:hypothetical protein